MSDIKGQEHGEWEVLRLIAQGQTNAAIAGRLVLSPKTVRNHVSNIYRKLEVADRAQAVIRAAKPAWARPDYRETITLPRRCPKTAGIDREDCRCTKGSLPLP